MHFCVVVKDSNDDFTFSIEGKDYYPWQQNLFLNDPFLVQDGKVKISESPGWGIEINQNWLNNADYSVSKID